MTKIVQPGQIGVVNHQVCTLRQRAIALVAANATQTRRPGSSAVDNPIAALAELGSQLLGESLIVVGDENGTHIKSSSDLRLEDQSASRVGCRTTPDGVVSTDCGPTPGGSSEKLPCGVFFVDA